MQSRIQECPECGGVMVSTWSDGKTRIHAMQCQRCGYQTDNHQRDTRYIESQHVDLLDELDTEAEYDEFVSAADRLIREAADEAFSAATDYRQHATRIVQVRTTSTGEYTVSAYGTVPEDGGGAGEDGDLPYGTPDVSWTVGSVFVNDSPLEMVDINGGSAWVYFRHVSDVEIRAEPDDPNVPDAIDISM